MSVVDDTTTEAGAPLEEPAAPNSDSRKRRGGPGRLVGSTMSYVVMIAVALLIAVPLVWMLLASFKDVKEIYTLPLQWLPQSWDLTNYWRVSDAIPLGRMFLNSVGLTAAGAGLKVILGLCCAYALVFVEVPFRKTVFTVVIFALLIPSQITIIPNYTLVAELGWLDTYHGIVVPGLASAFGTFLFRQHFLQLPISVLESAQIDGAGHWRRLWRFVVPMSMPTITAVGLVSIVSEWNEYLWPLLVTERAERMPLPVGLTLLQGMDNVDEWGVQMAATVVVTLPILIFFLVLQRRLVAGLTSGAVTG